MYASEEVEELGCGDDAEVERGVRGDTSFLSRRRGDVSEGFKAEFRCSFWIHFCWEGWFLS